LSLDDATAVGNGIPPGPIDNNDIAGTNNVELRENIIEDVDYVLLPAAAYLRLSQWYPSANATDPSFPRAVISTGQGNAKTERVELYPFCVPIARANEITGEPETVEYKLFSREGAPTLKTIVDHYMKDIDTSDHKDETKVGRAHIRLWAPGAFEYSAVFQTFATHSLSPFQFLSFSFTQRFHSLALSSLCVLRAEAGKLALVTKHYQSKPLDVLELGVGEFICVEQWVRMDKEWPRAQFERPLTDVRLHDDLDALDAFSNWCEGSVIQIEKSESGDTSILVHFTGWASKYDEWYNLSQPDRVAKLARCGTHTVGAYIPKSERAGAIADVVAATPSTTTTSIGSTSYSSYYKNTSTSYSYGGGADYYASERGATAVKGAAGLRNLGLARGLL
jgi:hypothetical protein